MLWIAAIVAGAVALVLLGIALFDCTARRQWLRQHRAPVGELTVRVHSQSSPPGQASQVPIANAVPGRLIRTSAFPMQVAGDAARAPASLVRNNTCSSRTSLGHLEVKDSGALAEAAGMAGEPRECYALDDEEEEEDRRRERRASHASAASRANKLAGLGSSTDSIPTEESAPTRSLERTPAHRRSRRDVHSVNAESSGSPSACQSGDVERRSQLRSHDSNGERGRSPHACANGDDAGRSPHGRRRRRAKGVREAAPSTRPLDGRIAAASLRERQDSLHAVQTKLVAKQYDEGKPRPLPRALQQDHHHGSFKERSHIREQLAC